MRKLYLSCVAMLLPLLSWAGPVNVNTADAELLSKELVGIGLAKAQAIIDYRNEYGRFESPARHYFQDVIQKLAARGCDAVVLGCTEIPLLIQPADSCLPVLDSTRILARAALKRAIGPDS